MSFTEIKAEELKDNPFDLIGKQWMLITAGNEEKCNTMTASWGGVGIMWGKPTATAYIRDSRYTKSSVDQELKIEISGPATLQGYGSARPNVEESFCNDTFKTFYGKSLAVIRAGYEPGTVTVKVSGKGLDTQELTLNIC